MEKKKFTKRFTASRYAAVVIGVSAGGIKALSKILQRMDDQFPLPIVIVQHLSPKSDNYLVDILSKNTTIHVMEVEEKDLIKEKTIYIAPPNYHTLIEEDFTFSLSTEGRVSYARPSVDVLFESAAYAYGTKLVGIILTGANRDGAEGLNTIKKLGGLTIVQNPDTAEVNSMPAGAIALTEVDHILELDDIADFLSSH